MPAIHLFGRRTILGGDDLQFGAFVTALLRCLQLTLLLGPVLAHVAHECRQNGSCRAFLLVDPREAHCRHAHLFPLLLVAYALSSCVYGLASLLLEGRTAHWSSVGTPTDNHVRAPRVSNLLEIKLVPCSLVLLMVWLTGISALCFVPHYERCWNDNDDDALYAQQQSESDVHALSPAALLARIQLWWVAIFFLLLSQASEILVAWLFLLHLLSRPKDRGILVTGRYTHDDNDDDYRSDAPHFNHELVEQMWADRCAAACQCLGVASCFAFGGRELLGQAEFGDVARALADYVETRGVLDVVPSDVMMGCLLLQRIQLERSLQRRRQLLVQTQEEIALPLEGPVYEDENDHILGMRRDDLMLPLEPAQSSVYLTAGVNANGDARSVLLQSSPEDMRALEEGARYANYALAIYTWVLFLYVHPFTGVPRLAVQALFSCFLSTARRLMFGSSSGRPTASAYENGHVQGDNLCDAHKTALLLHTGLERADLVYAQLRSSFAENPYSILLDHEWKSVVVSVRGTFSLEDCVTDVLIEPEPLEALGREFGFEGADQFCHGGVLLCARNIYRDLQRHGLLDELLEGPHARYPGYTLKFVGHSLGAATATLLSYMLRSKFPTLKCLNYSPPGWSLTWKLATDCQEWCTSFILDSDIVPRLSQSSMEVLRDEILELIGRVKVPKIEVVNRLVKGVATGDNSDLCFEPPSDNACSMSTIEEILYPPDQVPDSDYRRQLEQFKSIQEERRRSRGVSRTVKMYPPGKVIHLVKTGENRSCCHGMAKCLTCFTTNAGFVYTPIRIPNDALDEIVVNPHMGTDHFPNRMSSVIRSVASRYGLPC
jgi:sn1-specific diacylglycerol lipase